MTEHEPKHRAHTNESGSERRKRRTVANLAIGAIKASKLVTPASCQARTGTTAKSAVP